MFKHGGTDFAAALSNSCILERTWNGKILLEAMEEPVPDPVWFDCNVVGNICCGKRIYGRIPPCKNSGFRLQNHF